MKTRVKLDFVVEHPGDKMLGSFDAVGFIVAGILKTWPCLSEDELLHVLPGSMLSLSVVRQSKPSKEWPDPTKEEIEALKVYREHWGRYWKRRLIDDWSNAAYSIRDVNIESTLQRIRNKFGPRWLYKQKLVK